MTLTFDDLKIGSEWVVNRTQQRVRVAYVVPHISPPEVAVVDAALQSDEKTFRVGLDDLGFAPPRHLAAEEDAKQTALYGAAKNLGVIAGEPKQMESVDSLASFIRAMRPGSKITIEIGGHRADLLVSRADQSTRDAMNAMKMGCLSGHPGSRF